RFRAAVDIRRTIDSAAGAGLRRIAAARGCATDRRVPRERIARTRGARSRAGLRRIANAVRVATDDRRRREHVRRTRRARSRADSTYARVVGRAEQRVVARRAVALERAGRRAAVTAGGVSVLAFFVRMQLSVSADRNLRIARQGPVPASGDALDEKVSHL